jgi:hypothetical protein
MPVRRSLLVGAIVSSAFGLIAAAPGSADVPTPLALVTAAEQAASTATSVHVKAVLNRNHERLDVMMVKGRGAVGSLSESGYTVKLIRIANVIYAKGSPRFYAHYVGGKGARLLRGKWLEDSATTGDLHTLAPLLDMTSLLTQVLSVGPEAVLTQGPTATVVGQPVTQVSDSQGGTLSIATTGTPLPVRLTEAGSTGGSFTFTRWNGPVHLKAPVHVIDLR